MEDLIQSIDSLSREDRASLLQHLNMTPSPTQPASQPFVRKLRTFSGKKPVPGGEVDFETWHLLVRQVVEDEALQETSKKRLVVSSLLRPALDIVSNIEDSANIVKTLETVYGNVVEGRELYIQFLSMIQKPKEAASDYLQRLYLALLEVVDQKGAKSEEVPKEILQQFIRGTHEETLCIKLKLEEQFEAPPEFSKLLLQIRKEETKRKQSASVHAVAAESASHETQLQLEAQVQQLRKKVEQLEGTGTVGKKRGKSCYTSSEQRKSFFCYNCGVDGHKCRTCRKSPNPSLVQRKLLERQQSSKRVDDGKVKSASQSN